MKAFRILSLLFCLSLTTLVMAQKYEVDCLVGPEIKAIPAEKPTEHVGSRTVLYIPNGTLVDVVGRTVIGPDGRTTSHLGDGGGSVDVRQIKGIIHYDGRRYLVEARWLKFADENPPSATDRFASDNFRPRPHITSWLAPPRLDIHSASTRMLYSRWLPFMALLLMFLAAWMPTRTRFVGLSALPFFASVGIIIYMVWMIDWDALWWCNPDYVGIVNAIVGTIPLALFMALALVYLLCVTTFSKAPLLIWPIVIGYILQWPAMMVSICFTVSIWPALLVCYGIPVLINGLRLHLYGVVMTLVTLVAIHTFVVVLATVVQVSLWIIMAIALVSPMMAFLLSTIIGKYHHTSKETIRWITQWKGNILWFTRYFE